MDYDDYDPMQGGPPDQMASDPFADYDYDTLYTYYEQFKDTNPQVAEMIKQGLARKRQQMHQGSSYNPSSSNFDHKIDEYKLTKNCSVSTFHNTLEYLKTLIICLVIYRILKYTLFRYVSNELKNLLTAAFGVILLYKYYGEEDIKLIAPLLIYYISLKILYFQTDSSNSTEITEKPLSSSPSSSTNEKSPKTTETDAIESENPEKSVNLDNSGDLDPAKNPKSIPKTSIKFPIFINLLILLLPEIYMPEKNWAHTRGTNLIISLKLLTCLSESESTDLLTGLGYILHPASILFGPWTSIRAYKNSITNRNSIKLDFLQFFSLKSMCLITLALLLALFSIIQTTCITPYLFQDPYPDSDNINTLRTLTGWKLKSFRFKYLPNFHLNLFLYAFQNALSFRFSWYYIAFVSTLCCILTDQIEENLSFLDKLFYVCNPFSIEFPFCLSKVVVDWNRPISKFLKNYVYSPLYGNLKLKYEHHESHFMFLGLDPRNCYVGFSVVISFLISGLFHGLDYRIYIILFCLGLFSYTQHSLRKNLALLYDNKNLAPNTATKLKNQLSDNPVNSFRITKFFINSYYKFIFLIINFIHLIFLGGLMIQDEDFEKNSKNSPILVFRVVWELWKSMHFISFYMFSFMILIYLFTR